MQLSDFKIGEYFYTGSGAWKVIDVGTRTVVAYKVFDRRTASIVKTDICWDLNDEMVFYPYDWDGCSLEDVYKD